MLAIDSNKYDETCDLLFRAIQAQQVLILKAELAKDDLESMVSSEMKVKAQETFDTLIRTINENTLLLSELRTACDSMARK